MQLVAQANLLLAQNVSQYQCVTARLFPGVITPYKAQVTLVLKKLAGQGSGASAVEVNTVDAFQVGALTLFRD